MEVAERSELPSGDANGAGAVPATQQQPAGTTEVPPNNTIYINNLNEKIKIDGLCRFLFPLLLVFFVVVAASVSVADGVDTWRGGIGWAQLKKSLSAVFSQFGKIVEILAFKTLKHKGQAWVIFEDAQSAASALRQMQSFPFYDKPMRIQFAKTKSDIIAKADGTFVPREKKKRHDEKGRKKKEQHDPNLLGMGMAPYAGGYGAAPPLSQLPYGGGLKNMVPELPSPPNNILFIQNLPHETTTMMLQMFFQQYPGFKEVRMVETKPGIAFVEYGDEMQSTMAMNGLQGFKIQQNQMLITYAKK